MKLKNSIELIIITFFIFSCGDSTADIQKDLDGGNSSKQYEEKIVLDAYLIVNQAVEHLFIRRNIPTGYAFNGITVLSNAEVILTDGTTTDTLVFDTDTTGFYSNHPNFQSVKEATTYSITVHATINGKNLTAKSSTTTPSGVLQSNLYKADGATLLNTIPYLNNDDEIQLKFTPIPNAAFHVMYFIAESHEYSDLVQDHFFGPFEDENDYPGYISTEEILNLGNVAEYQRAIPWINFYFYSKYQFIIYAGDENFKNFYFTYSNVKDIDGNLSEPEFNITGDGIGIFGSAIMDTLSFTITK